MNEGSAGYTKQQLQDALIKLRASLNVSSYDQGATIYLSAERDTLLPGAARGGRCAAPSAVPAGRVRPRDPRGHRRCRSLAPGARRAAPGSHARPLQHRPAAATTLDDVKRFHADYWSRERRAGQRRRRAAGRPGHGGGAALRRLEEARGAEVRAPHLAAPGRAAGTLRRHRARQGQRHRAPAPDAAAEQRRTADYAALELAVHIFGGGGLESRLSERVRQKEGLTYGIGASLGASYWGTAGSFAIQASYAPDKRDRVIAVVQGRSGPHGRPRA
ncbi:hypothetical protein OSTOST_09061 [Ostertagia ostertagi]